MLYIHRPADTSLMTHQTSVKGPRRSPSVHAEKMELDEVCGMPILLNVEVDTCEVQYATVCRKPVHHDACDAKKMSTLRPKGAHIVSVVVDTAGGCFVYTDRSTVHAKLFVMKPSYTLDGVLPPDSVLHAFLFTQQGWCGEYGPV